MVVSLVLVAACGRVNYDGDASLSDATPADSADAGDGTDLGNPAAIVTSRLSGLSTSESGTADTFTIALASAPSADVTIMLSSSALDEAMVSPISVTFTADNFASPQSVTVTGVDDTLADGDQAFNVIFAPATSADARYAGLRGADVGCVNHDNDSPGILIAAMPDLRTSESGDAATFSVTLQTEPSADVSVSLMTDDASEGIVSPASLVFTQIDWDVPHAVTVTGVDDAALDGDVAYTVHVGPITSTDSSYAALAGADVNVTNSDNDAARLVVSPSTGLVTTELGGSTAFDVSLSAPPSGIVEIGVAISDPTEGMTAVSLLSFDTTNWEVAQTVEVTGIDDAVADGPQLYDAVLSIASSADPAYLALAETRVAITNTDDESAGVVVSPTSGLVTNEAPTTATFTVVLTSQPTADVTIALASSNAAEGTVSPLSVTFTPGDFSEPQTVTVTGVDDAFADGDVAYTVVSSSAMSADGDYSGLAVADVSLTNADNDTASIIASPSTGLVTTEAGGTATFDVTLSSEPRASVTLAVTSTNVAEGTVSPATLVFTTGDWNIAQTVTVTGVDDALADGAHAYEVLLDVSVSTDATYLAAPEARVSVSNADDETAGVTVNPTAGLVTSEMGGSTTLTLALTSQPTMDVTIPLATSNPAEGMVTPASVTFTALNWDVPQIVTVTGVNDGNLDGDTVYFVVTGPAVSGDLGYAGLDATDASVTNQALPVQQAPPSVSITSGVSFFGWTMSMSGDGNTIAVGAKYDDSNAVGINGDPMNALARDSGAVWIYERISGAWTLQAFIKASNTDADDEFGCSVALSDDGNTLAVGSTAEDSDSTGIDGAQGNAHVVFDSGAAYIFSRSGSTWTQAAYVKASNAQVSGRFGNAVALSDDGNTMAVASYTEYSDATGIGGNEASRLASGSGAAYVFVRSLGVWTQQAYVKASNTGTADNFGYSISLSGDGNTLAVGAKQEDSAATGVDGDQADNTVNAAGAVYVFARSGFSWSQQAYVKASNTSTTDWFGEEVELNGDGSTLVVSALGEKSNATGINGDQTNRSLVQPGAAYVFIRAGMAWSQQAYVKASNTEAADRFGSDLALSADGNLLAVGAIGERGGSPGFNGDQSDNSRPSSGAVYIFARVGTTWEQRLYVKASDPTNAAYFGQSVDMSNDGNILAVCDLRVSGARFYTFAGE